jgi:hypothetical protein
VAETWYRYEDIVYASIYDDGPGRLVVELREYEVLRHTPKGVWLTMGFGDKRFVLRGAHKRFACPTKLEARESFIARKRRQIRIHEAQAARARSAISLVDLV